MRNIYKYIDKKYLFPIFLGRIVNSGLVLAQPLILTKALKLDQDGLSYGKILNFVLFGLSVCATCSLLTNPSISSFFNVG